MKFFKHLIVLTFLFTLLAILISCGSSGSADSAVIEISNQSVEFEKIGDTYKLEATVFDKVATEEQPVVVWTTSNAGVATCENGVVTAVGYGHCVIRATYKNASSSCRIKVWDSSMEFELSDTEITLTGIGEKKELVAKFSDDYIITDSVTWSSSNASIAKCTDGVVEAVGFGTCTIQARLNSQVIKCLVTVQSPDLATINILQSQLSLNQSEEFELSYDIIKSSAGVTWISSDESVATCNNGKVYARSKGVCVIIAATAEGATDSCVVTVDDFTSNSEIPGFINFTVPEIGKELRYINRATGQLTSILRIISYELLGDFGDDGNYYIRIKLHLAKTYDINGIDNASRAKITTNLYMEDDVWCMENSYWTSVIKVGEVSTIECSLFTITLNDDGSPRLFYMLLDDVTES